MPARRLLPLVFAALAAGSAPAAVVAGLDGGNAQGPLTLSAERATVGGTALALADCDWLRLDDGPEAVLPARPGRLGVWLTDGSWLPAERVTGAGAADRVRVLGPFGELDLPLAAVAGWCTGELPAPAADGADRVTVAAGPLNGRIQGVREGRLVMTTALDPQPLELAVEDVRELRLAASPRAARGTALLAVLDPARPPLRLAPGAKLALAAAPAAAIDPAPLAGLRLRVDGPRRVWLSDLKPAAVDEQGAFGVVWRWQADHDLDGGALLLGGRRWAKGLSVHSQARLAWRLDGAYVRLRALAGIADALGDEGDCAPALLADGRELWRRASVKGGDQPLAIDVALDGAKELVLEVGTGARYDIGDHFTLADAYLVKKR